MMLSQETLQRYRQMSVGERLALTLKMSAEALPHLLSGTPEQVERKFVLLRRENNERNRRILEGLARAKPLS